MVIWFCLLSGVDNLRAMIGPLPQSICFLNVFVKNVIHCNMILFVLAITSTKFMFVCIYKSIPTLNDNFIAILSYITINMISFLIVIVMVQLPGKYSMTYVSRIWLRAQPFTLLKADLHQDINGSFAFSLCLKMEHFFEGSDSLKLW